MRAQLFAILYCVPSDHIAKSAVELCKCAYLANVTTPGSLFLQGGCHQDDGHRWSAAALRIQDDSEIQSIVVYLVLFLTECCAEQVS